MKMKFQKTEEERIEEEIFSFEIKGKYNLRNAF